MDGNHAYKGGAANNQQQSGTTEGNNKNYSGTASSSASSSKSSSSSKTPPPLPIQSIVHQYPVHLFTQARFAPVRDYLLNVRGLTKETLQFYQIGACVHKFPTTHSAATNNASSDPSSSSSSSSTAPVPRFEDQLCITFPWIKLRSQIEEMKLQMDPEKWENYLKEQEKTKKKAAKAAKEKLAAAKEKEKNEKAKEKQEKAEQKLLKKAIDASGMPHTIDLLVTAVTTTPIHEIAAHVTPSSANTTATSNELITTQQQKDAHEEHDDTDIQQQTSSSTSSTSSSPPDSSTPASDSSSTSLDPLLSFPSSDTQVTERLKLRSLVSKGNQRLLPSGGVWNFFGWHTVPLDAEEVVITEGEFDAMAVWQATGAPAVSLPNGARSLPVELLPLLEKFKKIYLWLDDDAAGREGAEKFAKKLGVGRCFIVKSSPPKRMDEMTGEEVEDEESEEKSRKPSPKDANDCLRQGLNLRALLHAAHPLKHEQIVQFADLRSEVLREFTDPLARRGVQSRYLPGLNRLLKGHRPGELTIVTGATGVGQCESNEHSRAEHNHSVQRYRRSATCSWNFYLSLSFFVFFCVCVFR